MSGGLQRRCPCSSLSCCQVAAHADEAGALQRVAKAAQEEASAVTAQLAAVREELEAGQRLMSVYESDMERVAEELEGSRGAVFQAEQKVGPASGVAAKGWQLG